MFPTSNALRRRTSFAWNVLNHFGKLQLVWLSSFRSTFDDDRFALGPDEFLQAHGCEPWWYHRWRLTSTSIRSAPVWKTFELAV